MLVSNTIQSVDPELMITKTRQYNIFISQIFNHSVEEASFTSRQGLAAAASLRLELKPSIKSHLWHACACACFN